MGHAEMLDHMFYDGLQSPFDGQLMGVFAENTAQKVWLLARRSGRLCHRIHAARL
jgi:acetyl-CoA acetyltransferase